jgi:hypothetical protein
MSSNIAVKITADVASLQSQLAIARAEFQQTQKAMNDLARQAASTGLNDKLKSDLQQASTNMLQAKQRAADLAKEMRDLQPATSGLHGAFEMLTHVAGAFGVALSIEKVVEFGRAIIENAAAIQHQADVLGLSVIGYQAFIESAKSAGAATESIDIALRRFNNSQGAAQAETGAQAEAFRKLGVNAFIPAEEALPAVAKALLNIQNTSERARMEMILFGRSGQEVNVALAQWARGTDELNKELSEQGLIIDPKTTEAMHHLEVQGTLTWDKIKVAAAGALVAQAETMKFMIGTLSFGAKFGGKAPAEKPAAAEGHGEEHKKEEKGNPELDQALAIAGAIDVSDKRINLLTSDIKLMKAELKDPAATEEMKKHLTSAISVAQQEIKTLSTKRDFAGTGFSNAGDKAIAEARVTISEINADQTRGDAERRAAIDQTYAQLLNSAKLNAAQIAAVEIDKNKAIAAANKQAATEKRQIDQATAQTEQRLAQVGFDTRRSGIEEEVTAGTLSRQAAYQQLLQLTDEETAARLRAVQQAQQGYAADTTFFIQKELEKNLIVAESEAQKAAIRRQAEQASASESAQIWRRSMQQVMSVEQSFESSLVSGRKGVLGSLREAGYEFAQAEIRQTIKGMTERLLLKQSELAADKSLGQLGLLTHWLFEGQKTAATAAGESARLATKESAKAAGSAADVASGSAQIMNDAYKAASGAYSAVAGIPVVGPILAPIAAGTAFAAVAAFDTLTSLDVGTNYVPRDMPAMIHQGERVVPRADNAALMDAVKGGGANNNQPVAFHYHAGDGRQADPTSDAKEMVRMFNHLRRTGAIKV